jgi:hypothetical protein
VEIVEKFAKIREDGFDSNELCPSQLNSNWFHNNLLKTTISVSSSPATTLSPALKIFHQKLLSKLAV